MLVYQRVPLLHMAYFHHSLVFFHIKLNGPVKPTGETPVNGPHEITISCR